MIDKATLADLRLRVQVVAMDYGTTAARCELTCAQALALIDQAERVGEYRDALEKIAAIPKEPACGWLLLLDAPGMAQAALNPPAPATPADAKSAAEEK